MQIQTLKRMIMLSGLAMLATLSAHAQGGKQVAVTIPFNFYAGGETLPAVFQARRQRRLISGSGSWGLSRYSVVAILP